MPEDLEYFNSEDFKEILRQYEESVKSGERIYMDADDLTDIADFYHYNNRLAEAEDAISLAIEYNPEAVGPMLYRAREALEKKDFITAEQYADKVEPLDSIETVYLRAEILLAKNEVERADELLKQYLKEVVPTDEHVDFVKGVTDLYHEYNQFGKAFEWITNTTNDHSDGFKELMARTLFGLGKYKDSEKLFNELLDKNPYSTNYWNALAGVQYMKEDYSAALNSSEYAIAIDPNDTNGLLSKANTLYAMGNQDEALKYYQKYSEKMPNDEFGFLHAAICLINKGLHQEGLEALKKAVSVSAVNSTYLPEIYQEMAFTYNVLGQMDKALWCLDMTDKLDCNHYHMGVIKGHILLTNKKLEEAKSAFKKVLKESGNNPTVILRVIISYHDNKFLHFAYESYIEFFKKYGEDYKEGYSYLALCCYDLKKHDEFLLYLKKACDCNPEEARTVLGELFPDNMNPKDYYEYALEHPND